MNKKTTKGKVSSSRVINKQDTLVNRKGTESKSDKVPVYKGCSALEAGSNCFCTGECKEIVGYEESPKEWKVPWGGTPLRFITDNQ